jgi:hypothetical protein
MKDQHFNILGIEREKVENLSTPRYMKSRHDLKCQIVGKSRIVGLRAP